MAFPTTLQDLDATRATAGQKQNNPNHITHHALEDSTIEALEAKVGIDGSAVTTSLSYKLSGISGIDKAVSKTGIETLTNKTLTSPTLNTPTITSPALTVGDDATGDLYYRSAAGVFTRLPIGAEDKILKSKSSIPSWETETSFATGSYASAGVLQGLTDAATSGLTIADGVVSVNSGTAANKIVKLDANAKLPAVDGSLLTNFYKALSNFDTITSTNLRTSDDSSEGTNSATYTKIKEILFNEASGIVNVKFALSIATDNGSCYGKIYKNGVAVGTERTHNYSSGWQTYSEDLSFVTGDLIQIYTRTSGSAATNVKEFRLYYDKRIKYISDTVN